MVQPGLTNENLAFRQVDLEPSAKRGIDYNIVHLNFPLAYCIMTMLYPIA